jgi:hypothetical protein
MLKLNKDEKIFVKFELEREQIEDANSGKKNKNSVRIKDIGIVRNVTKNQDGISIAVELVTLNDAELDKLFHATYLAYLKGKNYNNEVEIPNAQTQITEEILTN